MDVGSADAGADDRDAHPLADVLVVGPLGRDHPNAVLRVPHRPHGTARFVECRSPTGDGCMSVLLRPLPPDPTTVRRCGGDGAAVRRCGGAAVRCRGMVGATVGAETSTARHSGPRRLGGGPSPLLPCRRSDRGRRWIEQDSVVPARRRSMASVARLSLWRWWSSCLRPWPRSAVPDRQVPPLPPLPPTFRSATTSPLVTRWPPVSVPPRRVTVMPPSSSATSRRTSPVCN